jgi:hypothetical protein
MGACSPTRGHYRTCGRVSIDAGQGSAAQKLPTSSCKFKEKLMSLGTILLIVLILILIGVIPAWPHSRSWGYAPSGVLGLVVVVIIVLLLLGRL